MNKKIFKNFLNFCKKHWKKWTILLILAILVYIGFIFYKYVYKPVYKPEYVVPEKLEINEKDYEFIMEAYLEKEVNIENILNKNYYNPFKNE